MWGIFLVAGMSKIIIKFPQPVLIGIGVIGLRLNVLQRTPAVSS